MTVIDSTNGRQTLLDPFTAAAEQDAPTRPRVLSYVGRWGRARRWLPPTALRVLDVGCAFGYGSAAIGAGGPAGRVVIGVERDPEHLEMARRRFPWVTIMDSDAGALPVPDHCVDAVTMLDVIEHIADADRVLAEARRVLGPDGVIVVSVPHAGLLRRLDALNLYAAARRRWPSLPALEAATESDGGPHRHYTVAQLTEQLRPWFTVDRVARTGLGLQEFVTIAAIIIRVGMRAPRVAQVLLPIHLLVYVLDDLLPTGPLAYHLAVRAHVNAAQAAA
ncbi:MAG: class I SAM-dependent methyltransferase [Solirubrobacteraceae bacterium]|jgi:SAM-dependent methyltransferase